MRLNRFGDGTVALTPCGHEPLSLSPVISAQRIIYIIVVIWSPISHCPPSFVSGTSYFLILALYTYNE